MPKLKRSVKSVEAKTGFEAYDGPTPKARGMYRSVMKQCDLKQYKSGSQGYRILVELAAAPGDPKDHAQFDGFPIWTNLVFGEHDAMIARESNFYAAIGTKDEPDVVFEEGDIENGVAVKTIGGKKPLGCVVNADIKKGSYEGEDRPEIDGIYRYSDKGETKPDFVDVADDEIDEVDSDIEEGELTYEERETELKALAIAALRTLAESDYDLVTKGLKKVELVSAILDEEYGVEGVDEEDEDEEDEDVIESDEDEDEADEEEGDEAEERAAELGELDRAALKVILKRHDSTFRVLKSMTDEDLSASILAAEGLEGRAPF